MEETIEARVSPQEVWQAWEKVHRFQEQCQNGTTGTQGQCKGLKYKVIDVVEGNRFSILWKSWCIHLVFTHAVTPIPNGSKIRYSIELRGLFAWPIRLLLQRKIKKNLSFVMHAFVKNLESHRSAYADSGEST